MGIFHNLFGKTNDVHKWESIGILNNSEEFRNLSVHVPKCILTDLCDNVDSSYGTQIYRANGKTWKYKAVPTGSEWNRLHQGEHGNNYTKIEIFRRLK